MAVGKLGFHESYEYNEKAIKKFYEEKNELYPTRDICSYCPECWATPIIHDTWRDVCLCPNCGEQFDYSDRMQLHPENPHRGKHLPSNSVFQKIKNLVSFGETR